VSGDSVESYAFEACIRHFSATCAVKNDTWVALFAGTASFRMKEPNSKMREKTHRQSPQTLAMACGGR
jgi:3-phenylpropionate/cinnamic acid dioxygenase small subunit